MYAIVQGLLPQPGLPKLLTTFVRLLKLLVRIRLSRGYTYLFPVIMLKMVISLFLGILYVFSNLAISGNAFGK
jgi:hypothetical protein